MSKRVPAPRARAWLPARFFLVVLFSAWVLFVSVSSVSGSPFLAVSDDLLLWYDFESGYPDIIDSVTDDHGILSGAFSLTLDEGLNQSYISTSTSLYSDYYVSMSAGDFSFGTAFQLLPEQTYQGYFLIVSVEGSEFYAIYVDSVYSSVSCIYTSDGSNYSIASNFVDDLTVLALYTCNISDTAIGLYRNGSLLDSLAFSRLTSNLGQVEYIMNFTEELRLYFTYLYSRQLSQSDMEYLYNVGDFVVYDDLFLDPTPTPSLTPSPTPGVSPSDLQEAVGAAIDERLQPIQEGLSVFVLYSIATLIPFLFAHKILEGLPWLVLFFVYQFVPADLLVVDGVPLSWTVLYLVYMIFWGFTLLHRQTIKIIPEK